MPADPFQDLIQQLPGNFLILGDFNAHGTIWGCSHTNSRGRHLEDIIHRNNICILNTGSQTHIALLCRQDRRRRLTCPLSSASVADRFHWRTHASPCGSDHFPIWLSADIPHPGARTPQWNLRKADWTSFTADCNIELDMAGTTTDDMNEQLCNTMLRAAAKSIPKTSSLPKRIPVPWWSEECRLALREKRRGFRRFRRNPTTENLIHFRKARAHARRTVNKAKRDSWISYISTINRFTPLSSVWRRIHRISGRGSPIPLPTLTLSNNVISDPTEVANFIGQKWSDRWKLGTTHPTFIRHKRLSERTPT